MGQAPATLCGHKRVTDFVALALGERVFNGFTLPLDAGARIVGREREWVNGVGVASVCS